MDGNWWWRKRRLRACRGVTDDGPLPKARVVIGGRAGAGIPRSLGRSIARSICGRPNRRSCVLTSSGIPLLLLLEGARSALQGCMPAWRSDRNRARGLFRVPIHLLS